VLKRPKAGLTAAVGGWVGHADLPPDRVVLGRLIANRYLVEGLCERTAESSNYRAYHLGLDRSVLLRVLPERRAITQDACHRALELADRVSKLPNAHLGRTLDIGLVAGRFPFAVYEFSKGRSLAAVLAQGGPLHIERLVRLGLQLTGALETAHRAGVLHGSLRLDHLWLESLACRPEWLRLLGFGLCELPEREFEGPGSGVFPSAAGRAVQAPADGGAGSPTATEPSRHGALRAELYSLGCCLYELATGARPAHAGVGARWEFAGSPGSAERTQQQGFRLLVQRCLRVLPDTREYESLREVRRDLERLEASALCVAPAPPASRRPPVTVIHAPAPRARVALGGPKVIVQGG
jgi:serine/threonine protein kinase